MTWRFKTGVVDTGEEEEFVFFTAAFAEDGECAARLRHGFDNQYAGHHGRSGKWPWNCGSFMVTFFNRSQGFHRFERSNAVELQKRITVWDKFLNVFGFDRSCTSMMFVFPCLYWV